MKKNEKIISRISIIIVFTFLLVFSIKMCGDNNGYTDRIKQLEETIESLEYRAFRIAEIEKREKELVERESIIEERERSIEAVERERVESAIGRVKKSQESVKWIEKIIQEYINKNGRD